MKFDIFNDMKRNSLVKSMEDENKKGSNAIFAPRAEKGIDNVYKATIRLLPNLEAVNETERMYIKKYRHYFKTSEFALNGYVDSPSTVLGYDCPIGKIYFDLVKKGKDGDAVSARRSKELKRGVVYYTYCAIIDDKVNPDNNGKIKIFQFTHKLYEKIKTALDGDVEMDIEPKNPYDLINGHDLVLNIVTNKISNTEVFNDYTKCMFKPNGNPLKYGGKFITTKKDANGGYIADVSNATHKKFCTDFGYGTDGTGCIRPSIAEYGYKEMDEATMTKVMNYANHLAGNKVSIDNVSTKTIFDTPKVVDFSNDSDTEFGVDSNADDGAGDEDFNALMETFNQ